jgi:hypothetical protein
LEVRVVKRILAFLVDFARAHVGGKKSFHNDNLRANQGSERVFGPWRALVGL